MVRQPDFRLRGAVEIEISGPGVERFMNLCAMEGIALRSVRLLSESRAVVVLPLTDFHLLRPLLRAANCRFHIRRRIGLPFFLARLRKRQGLALGALLCLAILACVLVAGLNATAAGLHRLLPEAPATVFGLARNAEGQAVGLTLLGYSIVWPFSR